MQSQPIDWNLSTKKVSSLRRYQTTISDPVSISGHGTFLERKFEIFP